MEALEIELAYIQDIMDEEIEIVLYQCLEWETLKNCSELFNLDIDRVQNPLEILPEMIIRKADEHLPEDKAARFKALWQDLTPLQKMQITYWIYHYA